MDKDWRGKPGDLFKIIGASNHSKEERQVHDYYATDPNTINALFEREDFSSEIWEPACGEGHLSKRMQELGKWVRESDIIDRIGNEVLDFLSYDKDWDGDIITNPPYSKAKEFVEKALSCL